MTRTIAVLTIVSLALTACTPPEGDTGTTDRSPIVTHQDPGRPSGITLAYGLAPFDSCDAFLDYLIPHALELVGPYGLDTPWYYPAGGRIELFAADAAETTVPATAGHSGTNVQVLGVDEPDLVKTDGNRIVLVNEGVLVVADVTGPEPLITGRLSLPNLSAQSLFLWNDKVLLFGSSWSHVHPLAEAGDMEFAPTYQSPVTSLVEVDLSGDPKIIRTMTIDGTQVSARMVGDIVRVVSMSGPVGFEWSYPKGTGLRAERKAIEENRDIVRGSTAENWIPYYTVTDAAGVVTDEGILFDCERASHPDEFSGLDMLSITTIDLSEGLEVVDSMGLLSSGDTVYASGDSLYVATQNWPVWNWANTGEGEPPETVTTDIHKFDISKTYGTDYLASGRVDGYLINQFAMDEHDDLLRVATTTGPSWWAGTGPDTESRITVLTEDEGALEPVGLVTGLGQTEQIYSVRFIGDTAYVVTFRQTDPLYTVDLSDPSNPKVVGELKILGYSAYLHPVGEGLLLGIGQDADERGRVEGTQVSLFDMTDPADPTRIDSFTLADSSSSQVEWDHHAFLYWDPARLAVIPLQSWSWEGEKEEGFFGAVGLRIDDDGLTEIGEITHPSNGDWDYQAQIMRSIVIDDSVYTLSPGGIRKSDLGTLSEQAWLSF